MTPLISIIIPTYNRAHLIGETLDSIVAQTFRNWQCIVVDDGSTDYTDELLEFYCKKDSRIQYCYRPNLKPKGANACRNYGFELSKGDYIQWFDSDDLMHSECLSKKIKVILESNADGCVCSFSYFYNNDSENPTFQTINISSSENLLRDYLSGAINVNTQSVLWSRKILQHVQFNESLSRSQELDFHFRLLKERKVSVKFLKEVLVFIRGHQDSITGIYKRGNTESIKCELMVAREILDFVTNENYPLNYKNMCLNRYLGGLRNFYRFHSINKTLKELKLVSPQLKQNTSFFHWRRYFLPLLIIYKITGREFRLKNQLYNLKFYA